MEVDMDELARELRARLTRRAADSMVRKLELEIDAAVKREVDAYVRDEVVPLVRAELENRRVELVNAGVAGVAKGVGERVAAVVSRGLTGAGEKWIADIATALQAGRR